MGNNIGNLSAPNQIFMKRIVYLFIFATIVGCAGEKTWLRKDVRDWQNESPSPSPVAHSLFLVGDAGAAVSGDRVMVALERQLQDSESDAVVFLGDNLYPVGLRKKDHPGREEDELHLRAQVEAVATHAGQMVFVPGNHDWEQGGRNGYKNVKRGERFVEKIANRGNVWLPDDGCPGPVELPLADDATLIIIDTQWWLHRHDKPDHQYDCEVKYNADFIEMLGDALERNKHKKVVVVGHHPMYSYGAHGGRYPAHTHLFPGVMAKKNAYLPLPVLGSIAVIYRKAWGNIQDISHPIYQELKEELTTLLKEYPNATYAAGHDHNLQYLPVEGNHYIVSGSGSKTKYVGKGKKALFTADKRGFVRMDFHDNGEVWANFFTVDESAVETLAFRQHLYTKPTTPAEVIPPGPYPDYADSTVTVFGDDRYERGGFYKAIFGENYRQEWATEIEVPVFDMWALGLHIEKKGGGHQTKSMRLANAEGRHWVLRSIRKYPERATPEVLRGTFAGDVVQDQISASHPYSAFTVPPMAEAVGVFHTNPQLVWLPDDPRLGSYRELFGGGLYLFEERAAGDRSDIESFGRSEKITSTLKMVEKLHAHNHHQVDQRAALRARLFDTWMGDWDRHDDQWRWARFKEDGLTIYRPIPRDRDIVYFRPEGFATWVAFRKWGLRNLHEFDPEVRDINGHGFAARFWDRNFLTEVTKEEWIQTAREIQEALTDEVIDEALSRWPEAVYAISGDQIKSFLKSRLSHLHEYAETYYEFLATEVDVLGSNENELFKVERMEDGSTKVRMWNLKKDGSKGKKLYERVFFKGETREIRIWGMDGKDEFKIEGEVKKAIKVRVIMGGGKDEIKDESKVNGLSRKTLVYDRKDKDNKLEGGSELRDMQSKDRDVNDYDRRAFHYNQTAPLVTGGFNIDDGLFIGGGVHFRKYRFRRAPYALDEKLLGNIALGSGAFNLSYKGIYPEAVWGWDFVADADIRVPNYVQNFYGYGNETVIFNQDDIAYHRTRFNQFLVHPGLRKQFMNGQGGFSIGVVGEYTDVERTLGKFVTDVAEASFDSVMAFDPKLYVGGIAELDLDTRDSKVMPTRGFHLNLSGGHYEGLNETSTSFQKVQGSMSLYFRFRIPLETVLAVRVGGGRTSTDAPYFHQQYLGGTTNLRGFRKQRFAGNRSFYQNTELRIQIADFKSILFPAHFGVVGINDFGRVWVEGENSDVMHWGYGGGFWLTPFEAAAITFAYTRGTDGWLPYVSVGWKF